VAEPWGWASSVGDFLSSSIERWGSSLREHHVRIFGFAPSESQVEAWVAEHQIMFNALRSCILIEPDAAGGWSVIFEYELPMEGGRRPDVVLLAGKSIIVLEFKSRGTAMQSDIDQTLGYVRDLQDYHAQSAGRTVSGILVLAGGQGARAEIRDGVAVVQPESIASYIFESFEDGFIDLDGWLDSTYQPLPTLVEAARRIFSDEHLPHVHTAIAAGIPETVEKLGELVDDSANSSGRMMAFVTGVPGAGKTLVGLRLVYERTNVHGLATFLSGNGPLVQVLQDALSSKVFVRDLHAFIRTYALNSRMKTPEEHVIIFDEAQRAWDRRYMFEKKKVKKSEPELLIEIGERIPKWSALIGLVGEGQEIHSGEEAGIGQWKDAILGSSNTGAWNIHCPPKLAPDFAGLNVTTHPELDLNVTLRSRRAEDLHRWVKLLLEGTISLANQTSVKISRAQYQIYVTRSLDVARGYVRHRYKGEPARRFGLLASSHAKSLPKFGVDNSFPATSRMNIAKWFNSSVDDPKSSNALIQPVTEFGCQGLELDLPILCWGDDLKWEGSAWNLKPINRRYPQNDPAGLLRNTYRVLLTRGRDGLVIFVPPTKDFDSTEVALLAAGAIQLIEENLAEFADKRTGSIV